MLLLGNGLLISCSEEWGVIRDGAVLIKGDQIMAVGETASLRKLYPGAEFKDAADKVIMPAMINSHMHLYSTFARGMDLKSRQAPVSFLEILNKLWWRLDQKLEENDIYYSALYAVVEGIRQGTTTIFDHHASYGCIDGSLDIIAEVVQQTGIRANLAFEVSDRQGREAARAALRENQRFIKGIKSSKFLGGTIGLHASFTLSDQTLLEAASLSQETGVGFHLHTAEGHIDLVDSQHRGYQGVVERLNNFEIWQPGTLAVHGVHLQEGELGLLRESGTFLIHNPQSNMNNAVGAAPIKAAINEGVITCLGTDGYTTDMFTSTQFANLLLKHQERNPQYGVEESWQLAFINNRQLASTYFQQELGIIKPGAAADILLVDYHPPTPLIGDNFISHLLFGIKGDQVDTTIVAGKILMEAGEVKLLDYEEICRKTREQAEDFWRRF